MRSKTLFISNTLSTIYSVALLWIFGGAVIKAGGTDFIEALSTYFEIVFDLIGMNKEIAFIYAVLILLCIHIVLFTLGAIIGWLSYAGKKSGGAKFAATFYLLGTICFPVYFFIALPLTIIGFIAGNKQKNK